MAKNENVIGLWQDNEPGGQLVSPWIVSRDLLDEDGGAITTRTLAVFNRDDYSGAKERAIDLGREQQLRVVETDEQGQRATIYTPGTDS